MKVLSIRLPAQLVVILKRRADAKGIGMAQYAREILLTHFDIPIGSYHPGRPPKA